MKIKCFQLSSIGTVRDHNEDFIVFWEPENFQQLQAAGSIAVLADGVGGEGNGDIASRLAAETALEILRKPGRKPPSMIPSAGFSTNRRTDFARFAPAEEVDRPAAHHFVADPGA